VGQFVNVSDDAFLPRFHQKHSVGS
jgi:hypothetical protein